MAVIGRHVMQILLCAALLREASARTSNRGKRRKRGKKRAAAAAAEENDGSAEGRTLQTKQQKLYQTAVDLHQAFVCEQCMHTTISCLLCARAFVSV